MVWERTHYERTDESFKISKFPTACKSKYKAEAELLHHVQYNKKPSLARVPTLLFHSTFFLWSRTKQGVAHCHHFSRAKCRLWSQHKSWTLPVKRKAIPKLPWIRQVYKLWPVKACAQRVGQKIGIHLTLLKTLLQGTHLQQQLFWLLSCSVTPIPGKKFTGHFEPLTALHVDVPACEWSHKAALQSEKQHFSSPQPWRDAAPGQDCVPSNVIWPEGCLRRCKKGCSWITKPYSAVK